MNVVSGDRRIAVGWDEGEWHLLNAGYDFARLGLAPSERDTFRRLLIGESVSIEEASRLEAGLRQVAQTLLAPAPARVLVAAELVGRAVGEHRSQPV